MPKTHRTLLQAGAALSVLLALSAPARAQTAGDDRVTNADTLLLTTDRDFGAGFDVFTNKGVVRLDKAATPWRLSFLNLERFENAGGLVDLRNERAGDVLTLSGAYVGSDDARLGLDVDGNVVDRLVIAGAATGKTAILLNSVSPAKAVLLDKPIDLISVGTGSRSDAFSLTRADQGLVRYGLTYDSKTRVFRLNTSAGLAVHRSVRAVEGMRFAWRASAEAFDFEQAAARAAGGEGGRVWAVAHGARIDRDADGDDFALGYEQELVGGQMGASLGARPLAGGLAAYGVTGGYVDSTLEFEDEGQSIDMQTINLGLYGAWRSDDLFATALLKVDQHELTIEDPAAGFSADLDGLSWGARFEAGYRIDLGGLALEPVVGLDYLGTTLDDLNVLGQSVAFEDRQGFSGRIGGQALSRREFASGSAVLLSAGLELVHDFDAEQKGTLRSNGQTDEVALTGPETYGRALLGVQLETGFGVQTYLQGEGRFGDGQSGAGLRLGARYRF